MNSNETKFNFNSVFHVFIICFSKVIPTSRDRLWNLAIINIPVCDGYVMLDFIIGSSCNQTTETEFWNNGEAVFDVQEIFLSERFPNVVTAKDGSIVASLTIHRADPNTSTRSRKGLGFIYYSNLAKEDKLKHAAYQQKLKETLKLQNKI